MLCLSPCQAKPRVFDDEALSVCLMQAHREAEGGVTYQIKIIGGPKQIFQVVPDCLLPVLKNNIAELLKKKQKGQHQR